LFIFSKEKIFWLFFNVFYLSRLLAAVSFIIIIIRYLIMLKMSVVLYPSGTTIAIDLRLF